MKVAVDEWENEDAAKPERSGVYGLDDEVFAALAGYYKTGVVDERIEKGVKKIEDVWFLDYDRNDVSQRNHMVGLYVMANGNLIEYNGNCIENRFSTTGTPNLSIEEISDMLRI